MTFVLRTRHERPWSVPHLLGRALVVVGSVFAFAAWPAHCASFTKVADSSTPVPGGTGTFFRFGVPAIAGEDVAFYARGADLRDGVYARIGGVLRVIADCNTSIPGGTGNFTGFPEVFAYCDTPTRPCRPAQPPTIRAGQVVFHGRGGSGQDGIYLWDGASLRVVANRNTAAPGAPGNFSRFLDTLSFDNGDIAFGASAPAPALGGVYVILSGVLTRVWDQTTSFPGQYSPVCSGSGPSVSGAQVAFSVRYNCEVLNPPGGIFVRNSGGALSTIASTTTPIPGSTSTFTGMSFPSIHGGSVAFQGQRGSGASTLARGIYLSSGGTLSVVADKNTPIPGETTNFFSLDMGRQPSLYVGNVLFTDEWLESGNWKGGIYLSSAGSVYRVIGLGDQLDGKNLSLDPNFPALSTGSRSLGANNIAFTAQFADRSAGVYVVSWPAVKPWWWCIRMEDDSFFGRHFYVFRCWIIPFMFFFIPIIIFFVIRMWRRRPIGPPQ